MSVVTVKVNKDNLEFAADSIAIAGDTKRNNFTKLAEINGMVIGGVGYAEEISLLYLFARNHQPLSAKEDDILDFFFEFRQWKTKQGGEAHLDNSYIFGYKGKAYEIQNMYVKQIKDYASIGAGMNYALAALYLKHTAKEAVEVACNLSCYVAKPITVINMPTR